MKKVILTKVGSPEGLMIIDAEIPEPNDSEIQIKVDMAGIAFSDIEMKYWRYEKLPKLPYTPGFDVCGVVTKTGKNVKGFKKGDRVVALTQMGGYAEYAVAHEDLAEILPDNVDPAEATALGLSYTSAYEMLTKYNGYHKGGSLVVHDAAGGTGTALIQIAKEMGMKIYGTASAAKLAMLKSLGAIAIDKNNEEDIKKLEPEGVDMFLDPIGGEHWHRAMSLIKKGGSLISYGILSMFEHGKPISNLYEMGKHRVSVMIFNYGKKFYSYTWKPLNHEVVHKSLHAVVEMYKAGKIKPVIGKIYSLKDAPKALEDLTEERSQGKLVFNCNL